MSENSKLEKIISLENEILEREKKIEGDQKKLLAEEGEVLSEEKKLEVNISGVSKIGRQLNKIETFRSRFVSKIAKHRFIFSLLAASGVVLVWRGLWDISETLPILSSSFVALIVGLGLLWLLQKYTDMA